MAVQYGNVGQTSVDTAKSDQSSRTDGGRRASGAVDTSDAGGGVGNVGGGTLVAAQVSAYLLLGVCGLLPTVCGLRFDTAFAPGTLLPVLGAAILVSVYHMVWPFRGLPGLGRFSWLLSWALGLVSILFGWRVLATGDRYVTFRSASVLWACAFGVLMTVLVVVGFGRQMLRRDRSHLIITFSRCIISGVGSAAAGGWCFLPFLFVEGGEAYERGLACQYALTMVIVIAMAVSISLIGVLWRGDMELTAPRTWVGLALLPVMFAGLPVFLGALAWMFQLNW